MLRIIYAFVTWWDNVACGHFLSTKVSKLEISRTLDNNNILAGNNYKVLTNKYLYHVIFNSFLLVCQEAGATNKPELSVIKIPHDRCNCKHRLKDNIFNFVKDLLVLNWGLIYLHVDNLSPCLNMLE